MGSSEWVAHTDDSPTHAGGRSSTLTHSMVTNGLSAQGPLGDFHGFPEDGLSGGRLMRPSEPI